jgi:hypothetical protein
MIRERGRFEEVAVAGYHAAASGLQVLTNRARVQRPARRVRGQGLCAHALGLRLGGYDSAFWHPPSPSSSTRRDCTASSLSTLQHHRRQAAEATGPRRRLPGGMVVVESQDAGPRRRLPSG